MLLSPPGTKLLLESDRADTVCYVLSCSVTEEKLDPKTVSWWEGTKKLQEHEKGQYSLFEGKRSSQLHICLGKEVSGGQEETRTGERSVVCCFADQMSIPFNVTGKEPES